MSSEAPDAPLSREAGVRRAFNLLLYLYPASFRQTLGQDLPEGFQTAEFLLEHGVLDAVVHRRELKPTLSQMLRHMTGRPAAAGYAAS